MHRRAFLGTVAGSLLAAPLAAEAQQAAAPRIGWLIYGGTFSESSPGLDAAILRGLKERGYVDGKNLAIEYRYAEGRSERLPELVDELVRLKVNLLLAVGGDIAAVLKKGTSTIPVVVAMSTDPVRAQLVASLARPGGNITGVTFVFDELAAKRVELVKEILPSVSRIGVLWDPTHVDNDFPEVQRAAQRLGVDVSSLEVRRPDDLDQVMRSASQARMDALIVVPGRLTVFLRARITETMARQHVAVISGWREFAEGGAVLSYGPDRLEGAKRTAIYVDRILRGAKPAELPIEQPTKFELVINLKTAKALGLTIPQSLLQRADQVIE